MPSSPSSARSLTESPGRVVSGHGRRLVVEAANGGRTLCHTRGKKSEAVVLYSWQPGTLAQHVRAGNVTHAAIPETLVRRFGLHRGGK